MADHDSNQPDPNTPEPSPIEYGSAQPGQPVTLTPAQKAAQGAQADPKTVAMDVLRDGSFAGTTYYCGESVDVPEALIETLMLAGFAARADRVETAQKARANEQARRESSQQASQQAAAKRGGRSTAAAPLTTHDMPGAQAKE